MMDTSVHTTIYDFRNSLTAIAMSLYLAEKTTDETVLWQKLACIQGELEFMTRRLSALESQMSNGNGSHEPRSHTERGLTNVDLIALL